MLIVWTDILSRTCFADVDHAKRDVNDASILRGYAPLKDTSSVPLLKPKTSSCIRSYFENPKSLLLYFFGFLFSWNLYKFHPSPILMAVFLIFFIYTMVAARTIMQEVVNRFKISENTLLRSKLRSAEEKQGGVNV